MSGLQIGQGHVYHSRHDGIGNAFRYPTFFLMFRCDQEAELQTQMRRRFKNILSFSSRDYLTHSAAPLGGTIKEFLKSRCGYEAEEVWLHTLPRMFGYVFNPVNFWLCRRDGRLDAVLCEVNNTFGEKHYYWLQVPEGIQPEQWLESKKVFHVSPFLPVEGSFKFRFNITDRQARIDIFYYKDNQELRLSTWIDGELQPLESVSLARIVLRYGWITPLVILRIHIQAVRLWWRKAQFYKKPDLPTQEITQ